MQQEGHILQDAIRIAKEAENRFLEYLVSTCDARLHEQVCSPNPRTTPKPPTLWPLYTHYNIPSRIV
jgi:hypothetical protein